MTGRGMGRGPAWGGERGERGGCRAGQASASECLPGEDHQHILDPQVELYRVISLHEDRLRCV
jgi:hypothetical protein